MDRETQELLDSAKLYLDLFESIQSGEKTEFIKWCHLASAAIRISTLHEKNGKKIKKEDMERICNSTYDVVKEEIKKDLVKYAYILLRDNICHFENKKMKYYEYRPQLIKAVGMDQMWKAIKEDYCKLCKCP